MEDWAGYRARVNQAGSRLTAEQKKRYPESSYEALTHQKGCKCRKCIDAGFGNECRNPNHSRSCRCG